MEVLLDSMVRPDVFDKISKLPRMLKHGKEVFLVSKKEGLVADVNIDQIRRLASCVRIDLNIQPGMRLFRTNNVFSRPGSVQLVNASGMYVYMVGYIYICMYVCMYACTYLCMFVCIYVCIYMCTYIWAACINIYMYIYVYVCMYTIAYSDVYIQHIYKRIITKRNAYIFLSLTYLHIYILTSIIYIILFTLPYSYLLSL